MLNNIEIRVAPLSPRKLSRLRKVIARQETAPTPAPLLGVGLYFRKAAEGSLSILKWLSKKGVFYIERITLVRPTLGY